MLRGCLSALGLYVALAVGYFFWFDSVFEPPATFIGAAVVGFLVLCCVGALTNARTALRDWSLVSTARHSLPPRDGELIAVIGTIHPLGDPLRAPFSGSECVVCEYDLARPTRATQAKDGSNSGSDYAGFLMTPCAIRSALGDMRLLGFPILEGFDETVCHGDAAIRNARNFLSSAPFEDRAGLKLVTVLSVFTDVWSDEDGLVQKNIKLSKAELHEILPEERWDAKAGEQLAGDPGEDDTENAIDQGDESDVDGEDVAGDDVEDEFALSIPRMKETRVAVGEQVCVIGVYDEMRRGLLPPKPGRNPNRLIRGSADQIEQKSRSSLFRNLIGSLVALIVIHAAIYGVMQAYLHSPEGQRRHNPQAVGALGSGGGGCY